MKILLAGGRKAISNPLEWGSSGKSMMLLTVSLLLHGQYTLWGHYLLTLSDRDAIVHVDNLTGLLDSFHGLILLSLLLCVALPMYARLRGDQIWYEYLAALYYGLTLCYFSYTVGTMTLPTGAALAGAPVVGFILFNRGAVMTALLVCLCVHIGVSYATALGYLNYAPIINQSLDSNGQLSLFWMTMMYFFTAPHLVFLIFVTYYVLRRWRQREDEIRMLSLTDPLTGICNRRSILAHLVREQDRSSRQGPSLSVIMVDLDHFKQINDTWGHPIGDKVLIEAAAALREVIRQNDQVGRFGGEEFLVVLPGTDATGALLLAERCRARLMDLIIEVEGGRQLTVTGSFGLVCNEANRNLSVDELLRMADDALYAAKEGGRNQIAMGNGSLAITRAATV